MIRHFYYGLLCLLVTAILLHHGMVKEVKAASPTIPYWEFYPEGINYLHSSYFAVQEEKPFYYIYGQHRFRVKNNTEYIFMNYLSGEFVVTDLVVRFYREDNTLISTQTYSSGDITNDRITFTTSSNVAYMKLDFDLFSLDIVNDYYIIDKYFIVCESIHDPMMYFPEEMRYVGPILEDVMVTPNQVGLIETNVDFPITAEQLKGGLRAYDDQDGDITNNIVIDEDFYSPNKHTLGTYPITFKVEDSSNNSAMFTIYVTVFDATKPEFSGITTYSTKQNQKLSLEHLRSGLQAIDNYDGNISSNIVVKEDFYTDAYQEIGIHSVLFEVSDSSGNKEEIMVFIEVRDGFPPVFSGPTSYTIGNQDSRTLSQFKEMVTAIDGVDGVVPVIVIFDEYSINQYKIGQWMIQFSATDNEGNTSYHTLFIHIVDNTPPVFFLHRTTIYIGLGTEPLSIGTIYQISSILSGFPQVQTYEVTMDSYTSQEKTPGSYQVVYEVEESSYLVEIEVVSSPEGLQNGLEGRSIFRRIDFFFRRRTLSVIHWGL